MSNKTHAGWPVIPAGKSTGDLPRVRKFVIPGTGRHFILRDGIAGFILAHVLLWFHEAVERLNLDGQVWDEWGHAVRAPRGGTGWSEHAGAVAADANATLHPMGVPIARTFTTKQIRRIRRRLRVCYLGFVVWGGEWKNPDGMHFELASFARFGAMQTFARTVLVRTKRGKRILAANPGLLEVIKS